MASEVSICNSALLELGEDFITALTEDSKAARLCNLVYSEMRDELLRKYPWNFATERKEIGRLTSTPPFGFAYEYQLPSDCLRVLGTNLGVEYSGVIWKVEGRKLRSDMLFTHILYIRQETNTTLMDPLFRECLAARIAWKLAIPLTDDRQLANDMAAAFMGKVSSAYFNDAIEGTPDNVTMSPGYLEARY